MKLHNLTWAAVALLVFTGCKKDNEGLDNPEGPQGSGTMEVMTPEESKTFLQNSVVEFLNQFNPEEQKAAIELAAYFSSEYGDYEAPEEFDIEPDGAKRTPKRYLNALSQAARGDVNALVKAASTYSYTLNFNKFKGVYEPNHRYEEWERTGSSNDIIFKFYNKNSQPVELKISQSGGSYDVDFSIDDWEWDYVNGKYEEYEVKYNYFLSIPKTVTVTLTENGTKLASSTIVSNVDIDGHTLSADVTASLMNLRAEAKISGNDSKVEMNTGLYVSDSKVATAYATINGHDLCNKKKYESFEDMDDDEVERELEKMLDSGSAGVDMLGKVQVYGQVKYYRQLPNDLSAYFDDYDYSSKEEARKECEKVCDRLNKNVTSQLRYNNTATDQATIQFAPYLYESYYGSWWEYEVTGKLYFYQDKTTYDIDSYFENFTKVTGKWESLVNAYESVWNLAYRRR